MDPVTRAFIAFQKKEDRREHACAEFLKQEFDMSLLDLIKSILPLSALKGIRTKLGIEDTCYVDRRNKFEFSYDILLTTSSSKGLVTETIGEVTLYFSEKGAVTQFVGLDYNCNIAGKVYDSDSSIEQLKKE